MVVNFDVPKDLKKGDILLFDGKKFIAHPSRKINDDLNNKLILLENKLALLEQRININLKEKIRELVTR